jgi:hypothetical protein
MKTTFKVLNEKFLKLQEAYNQHQSKFPDIISQYAPVVQEEEKTAHLQEGVSTYKPKFQDLLAEVGSTIRANVTDKNKLKYPLRASENSTDRLIGEQKLTNVRLLFTQLKDSPALLASELQNLIDANDSDSANNLIDIVILQFGIEPSQDLENFNHIKDVFNQNAGLNDIDFELKDLQVLNDQVTKVIAALTENVPYILFPTQTSQMSEEEYYNLRNNLISSFGQNSFSKIQNSY